RRKYEELKKTYLKKNITLHALYNELRKEVDIDEHTFFRIINRIREEEGYEPLNSERKRISNKKNHYHNP
ncbi:MAG: hypothetical protein K6A34_07780, partial [Methanobrevibacter sp.]|nr:hypothetical protein [Methanobrevibacter sp.]